MSGIIFTIILFPNVTEYMTDVLGNGQLSSDFRVILAANS